MRWWGVAVVIFYLIYLILSVRSKGHGIIDADMARLKVRRRIPQKKVVP